MVVTMNNGLHVVFLEVALKRPVVGKAKRDRGVSLIHGTQRNDIPAVIGVSDARERLASHRMKVRELNGSSDLGFDF